MGHINVVNASEKMSFEEVTQSYPSSRFDAVYGQSVCSLRSQLESSVLTI